MAEKRKLLLVDATVLPPVFERILRAKSLLASGEAETAAAAARIAGLSRSAYYKYKDTVFPYESGTEGALMTAHMMLQDRPGVLSSVLAAYAEAGANIVTLHQNIPVGRVAAVSVTARIESLRLPVDRFVTELGHIDGVGRILRIHNE